MPNDPYDESDTRISQDALKYFTDRIDYIQAFHKYLDAPVSDPLKVLVFCGVGGIGKTSLISKLSQELHGMEPPVPHARFDLKTLKSPVQARREVLVRLRTDLGAQFHLPFPRFDLCLALMLAGEGGADPNLVKVNPTLNSVYQFALGLMTIHFPLVGVGLAGSAALAGHIAKQGAKRIPDFENWLRRAGGTEGVIELRRRARDDDQTLPEELMRRFILDLKEGLPARTGRAVQGVLFLDTYERLWTGRAADGSQQSRGLDEWVRTLASACLHRSVLLVITGRDHLRWERDEPGKWTDWLEQHQMGGLSALDAQVFLSKCGIGDDPPAPPTPIQQAIIQCADERVRPTDDVRCHPLFLALCAEIVLNTRRQTGQDPSLKTFHGIPAGDEAIELADRFLQSLHDRPMERWLEELSLVPRFDKEAALSLRGSKNHYDAETAWELLTGFSFATSQPDGFWRLHETMRDALSLRVAEDDARRVHTLLRDHWAERDDVLAFFHRWSLGQGAMLDEWKEDHGRALKERRITDARRLLTWWNDISLDDTSRRVLGDQLWAATHYTLGMALWKTPIAPRAAVLAAAVEHYEAALRVWTEAGLPQQWAATQNNLGVAYRDLPVGERAESLRRAIACYEAALRVHTEADFPQDWAMTQNNLGNAYSRLPTGDRAENLRHAITCYEAALRVYTEADFLQQWAMIQNNLGNAYRNLPTGDRAENLRHTIACHEAALRVYTEADFPQERAMTQNNLGNVYKNLPTGDGAESLEHAIACYEAALRVHTEADFPQDWAMAQNNLGTAYGILPTGDRAENLRRAIACYEAALRVYTEADFPQDWAMAQYNLGSAYRNLPTGDRAENLERAIACYEAGLRTYTEADFPQQWTRVQFNIAVAYEALGQVTQDARQLIAAREAFAAAERGYFAAGLADEAAQMRLLGSRIQALLNQIKEAPPDPPGE